jgi:hypothetical protein
MDIALDADEYKDWIVGLIIDSTLNTSYVTMFHRRLVKAKSAEHAMTWYAMKNSLLIRPEHQVVVDPEPFGPGSYRYRSNPTPPSPKHSTLIVPRDVAKTYIRFSKEHKTQ